MPPFAAQANSTAISGRFRCAGIWLAKAVSAASGTGTGTIILMRLFIGLRVPAGSGPAVGGATSRHPSPRCPTLSILLSRLGISAVTRATMVAGRPLSLFRSQRSVPAQGG
jgi:hypothetical protein